MCFYYQLSADSQKLENRFKKDFSSPNSFQGKSIINAFEYPTMPVITDKSEQFQFFTWGLLPHWAKEESLKKYTLNARIETLSEKASFKNSIHQRCLIPATGFYEWKWVDSKGKNKEKYFILSQEQSIFSFAGLYSFWVNQTSGETVGTFTIITTHANSLLSKIHHTKKRMPVILKKEDERSWLEGANYKSFAFPYQTNLMAQALP